MGLIELAQVEQLPAGVMKSFPVGGKQILVTNFEGRYYAVDNKCPHAGGKLSEGTLEGKFVTCPNHGSKYDVTTGKCVLGPKIGFIRMKAKDTRVYEIQVDGNSLKVGI